MALISDAGTPGFCDPGAQLVAALRAQKEPIYVAPGASSLMYLLSLSSQRLDDFYFLGFPPAKKAEREKKWQQLKDFPSPIVVMETPYRLPLLLAELRQYFPRRKILLGTQLSQETEFIWEGWAKDLPEPEDFGKAEPVVLLYAP